MSYTGELPVFAIFIKMVKKEHDLNKFVLAVDESDIWNLDCYWQILQWQRTSWQCYFWDTYKFIWLKKLRKRIHRQMHCALFYIWILTIAMYGRCYLTFSYTLPFCYKAVTEFRCFLLIHVRRNGRVHYYLCFLWLFVDTEGIVHFCISFCH